MTAKYQVIYWRDIPTQVKMKVDGKRSSRPLSRRFMGAVSAAATRAGKTDNEDYIAEWRTSGWQEVEQTAVGDAEELGDTLAAQLEADYPGDRLRQLVKQGGLEK
jgi:hypothetical protein